jgi:multiple sugar transport system substrate-binding protein/sn-glycerol 3-phosphate transport system substrate-binding protein
MVAGSASGCYLGTTATSVPQEVPTSAIALPVIEQNPGPGEISATPPTEATIAPATVAASPEQTGASGAEIPAPSYNTAIYGDLNNIDLNGTEVSFLHMHYDEPGQVLETIIERFNAENPYGIHVTAVVPGSYPEVQAYMDEAVQSGADLPALVSAYQHWAIDWVAQDALVALEPYLESETYGLTPEERADFFPAFLAHDRLPQFDNRTYGFPYRRSQGVIFYNADWLAELYDSGAISFAGPPRTPEQFVEAACAATAKPGAVGFEIATEASRIAAWTYAYGGDIYDAESGRFTWDSPGTVAAMQMMQDLYQRGCAKKIAEHQGELFDFSSQMALFVYGSSAYMPIYQGAVADDPLGGFSWSMAPIPYVGEAPVQNSFGPSLSIPRTDPATQLAAWLFVKYLTQPEIQAEWAAGSDYFPVRRSAYQFMGDYVAEHPAYADGFALLPYSVFEPSLAGYDLVHDMAASAYFRILAGEDVVSVLTELNEAANAILANMAP